MEGSRPMRRSSSPADNATVVPAGRSRRNAQGRGNGAHEQIRTADRLLTMQVLYRLSYVGPSWIFFAAQSMERETGFEPATLSLEG